MFKPTRVLVTGASGLLGRAVLSAFQADAAFEPVGLSYTRTGPGLRQLDLQDEKAVKALFEEVKPQVVVHAAAERRPDVVEKNPEAAEKLNVKVPALLGELSAQHNAQLIYISTDYVFDGTSPPYDVDDKPNPLQFYGKTKLAGEKAAHEADPKAVALRVPVLYGKASDPAESAVNILLNPVRDHASGKRYKMEHYASRFPTNVQDVAAVLVALSKKVLSGTTLPPTIHYTAQQPMTKYEMAQTFAKILGTPIDHLDADTQEPVGQTSRPKDCRLSRRVIESIDLDFSGLGGGKGKEWDFAEWWTQELNGRA